MGIRIGIIGGGAAGMAAAVTAAARGAEVTIMEGNDRLGKKILSTGNGKCNLGNEKLDISEYYTGNPLLLDSCLRRFGTEDTIAFFRDLGLMIKSRNGYLYPLSEQAAVVLDVLRYRVAALGIRVITNCRIAEIEMKGTGKTCGFDRLILACGGCAAPKTGSDGSGFLLAKRLGHKIVPVVPALVQLRCREDYMKSVAGVRAEALVEVLREGKTAAMERGELLLTDYGISGIPVFQISRVVNYILSASTVHGRETGDGGGKEKNSTAVIRIDLMPDYPEDFFDAFHVERMRRQGKGTVEEFFTGMLHKKLMLLFIKLAGLKPLEKISGADPEKIRQVYRLCRQWEVHVTGSNSYDNAQVCAGGVALDEVTENLESKKVRGVYFAGEILDVDGKCGGYNLQWAWTSGFLAGSAAAEGGEKRSSDRSGSTGEAGRKGADGRFGLIGIKDGRREEICLE